MEAEKQPKMKAHAHMEAGKDGRFEGQTFAADGSSKRVLQVPNTMPVYKVRERCGAVAGARAGGSWAAVKTGERACERAGG